MTLSNNTNRALDTLLAWDGISEPPPGNLFVNYEEFDEVIRILAGAGWSLDGTADGSPLRLKPPVARMNSVQEV